MVDAPAADRRGLLIEAARALFGAHSYESVTTTEIARNAGVAYGLIAHHFGNKRGLYLAVMGEIRNELGREQDAPLSGDSLEELLDSALRRHVEYIDAHQSGFRALMRGDLGADPELQQMFDELRWGGASRILQRIGVEGEPPASLRAGMKSWVALFDELMLDRIENGTISVDVIVSYAASALVVVLQTARGLDSSIRFAPEVEEFLAR